MYTRNVGSQQASPAEIKAATDYVPRNLRKAVGQAPADQYAGTEESPTPRHLPAGASDGGGEVRHWWEVRADQQEAEGAKTAAQTKNKQPEAAPARSVAERAAETARTLGDRLLFRNNRIVLQSAGNDENHPAAENEGDRPQDQPRGAASDDRGRPPPIGGSGRRTGSPDDESRAQRALEAFTAAHPDLADRFQGVSARNFLRAFGDAPDPRVVAQLSSVAGFRQILDTDPGQARRLYTDPPEVYGRPKLDALMLHSRKLDDDVLAAHWGDAKRMLLSADIDPEKHLGYRTRIRPVQSDMEPADSPRLVPSGAGQPRFARVTRFTDTAIAADGDEERTHTRLVEIIDDRGERRVVQAKTYIWPSAEWVDADYDFMPIRKEIELEARTAQLYAALGIGPEYHGICQGPDGNVYVVTDILPIHRFEETPVNRYTLRDLETILDRLENVELAMVAEGLTLVQDEGGGLVVGRPGIEESLRGGPVDPPVNDVDGAFTVLRAGFVVKANPLDGLQYFEHLKDQKSAAWQSLMSVVKQRTDLPRSWRAYLERHGF